MIFLCSDDLRHHRLIHDNYRIGWATWLSRAGVHGIDAERGVRFDSAAYAVEAAVQGEGVLLGRSALVSADLTAGRLVRPFDLALASRWRYYVVYPEGALRQRKVKSFRDWLFDEMEADRQQTRDSRCAEITGTARPANPEPAPPKKPAKPGKRPRRA